jgi:hypothetical protein
VTLTELQLQIDEVESDLRSAVTTDHETLGEILVWMKGVQSYLERLEKERRE